MSIITKMLKQSCVYWAPTGVDGDGQPTYDTPVVITCRWESELDLFLFPGHENPFSNKEPGLIVYVGQDVEVKGVLLEGLLGSSVDQADPKANAGAREILKFARLPNFKATEFLRTALL